MARVGTPPLIPTTSAQQGPHYVDASMKNTLVQLVKISKIAHRGRSTSLAKNPDVQTILDNDLFMIQPDRRTKLTPIQQYRLVHVLAQFFLERVEDGNRYSYFEAIFLGRENDVVLNEFRMEVLVQLASFSLQFPVIQVFNHISGWLSKISDPKLALSSSEMIVEMLVDHFITNSDPRNKLYEFLLPLELSCAEFAATFFALAPYLGEINESMCVVLQSFMITNMQFALRHLRDTPYLADAFAKKSVPEMVKYIMNKDDSTSGAERIVPALCYILDRWGNEEKEDKKENKKEKSKDKHVAKPIIDILDLVLAEKKQWSMIRVSLISVGVLCAKKPQNYIIERLNKLDVPPTFQPYIDQIKDGKVLVNNLKM